MLLSVSLTFSSALAAVFLLDASGCRQVYVTRGTGSTLRRRPLTLLLGSLALAIFALRSARLGLLGLLRLLPDHLLVEFLAGAREDLLDVLTRLGTSLKALMDVVLAGILYGEVELDLARALHLSFVSN